MTETEDAVTGVAEERRYDERPIRRRTLRTGSAMKDELSILLVEDDPDGQANLIDVLQLDGHQVRVASSLSEIRDAGVQNDVELVILDRLLPDGNVEDALPELTEWLPNAEFIVVTGFADVESTIKAFRLGVTDYMLKPVHPDVIRQSVARIARQKRMEMKLQQEQQFANQILDTAEGFIVVLDLEGRVLRINQYFTDVTGWELDDLLGKEYIEHCIPESERDRVREVLRTTASGTHTSGIRNGVLMTDGHVRQIRWSDSTLKDKDGKVNAVLAIGVDVTEVIEAQEAAARDHRLAAIGQTVAGLAHESRNALHRIQSAVEILRLDIPVESDSREEVESIARATTELNNTLEEVRQFAAPIHLHRESVLLHEVWQRVWGYLFKVRDGRDAELVDANCGCPVKVDVLRMEQVFRNLFENSLAACEDPVRIQIRCQCDGADMICLEIEDNGPGLDKEQREKLFEPFFTTKSRGTGLGMSIVQRVVEAHGGNIEVGDAPEHGAKVLIRLQKERSQ